LLQKIPDGDLVDVTLDLHLLIEELGNELIRWIGFLFNFRIRRKHKAGDEYDSPNEQPTKNRHEKLPVADRRKIGDWSLERLQTLRKPVSRYDPDGSLSVYRIDLKGEYYLQHSLPTMIFRLLVDY
jgi:hypothetical protein